MIPGNLGFNEEIFYRRQKSKQSSFFVHKIALNVIMESVLICFLLISMMYVGGGQGMSSSMSCSFVNGVQRCTQESGSGNVAMSSSRAGSGPYNSYSDDFASTGNTGNGRASSSRITSGNVPNQGGFAFGGMPPGFGGMAPGGFDPFAFVFGRR
ncbi:uncharacterized protein [Parasteatoda tepidariorum]|uniref:uncharacterized protein isoform X2 n=1 Tax=Parasteatoda tepidariorum TaxID=114398 RepID=UPI0039BD551C